MHVFICYLTMQFVVKLIKQNIWHTNKSQKESVSHFGMYIV